MKRSRPTGSSSVSNANRPLAKVHSRKQLAGLQATMATVVMQPLTPGYRMQKRAADGRAMETVAGTFIKPNDRLTASERLEIYNRQYWFRILDCFADDYPGVCAVIGDRRFNQLARAYLTNYPSESFTLRNLGRRLTQFLQEEPHWTEPRQELAMDMARLEWAHIVAFDEAQKPPIDVNALLGQDPESARLALQPYISLLELNYPVDDFLLATKKRGDELRAEASNAVEQDRRESPVKRMRRPKRETIYLAVHRVDLVVYYKRLDVHTYRTLTAIANGSTLGNACAKGLRGSGLTTAERSELVQKWFREWTSWGWFTAR